jgi:hypothetical protein
MTKTFFSTSNKAGMGVIAVTFVFLLQSCCFLFGDGAAKRPCNCKNDKPDYAVNSKPQPSVDAAPVSKSVQPSKSTSNPAVETLNANNLLMPRESGLPEISDKKLPLGIKGINTRIIAAPNLSFKSSKEDYGGLDHKNKPGVGLQLGIGTTFIFSKKFAVNTSLAFKHNSAKEVLSYSAPLEPGVEPISEEYESKYSYSYISAPILAEVKVSDRLTVMAGPEINYLVGASVKSASEKTDIKDNSVKFGAGLQLGLRYDLPGSPFGIQLLYDHRLSRLNEKTAEYYPGMSYEMPAWNMKSVQVGVVCDICQLFKK